MTNIEEIAAPILSTATGQDTLFGKADIAGGSGHQTRHNAQQAGFTRAIRARNLQDVSWLQTEGDRGEKLTLIPLTGQLDDVDLLLAHRYSRHRLYRTDTIAFMITACWPLYSMQ